MIWSAHWWVCRRSSKILQMKRTRSLNCSRISKYISRVSRRNQRGIRRDWWRKWGCASSKKTCLKSGCSRWALDSIQNNVNLIVLRRKWCFQWILISWGWGFRRTWRLNSDLNLNRECRSLKRLPMLYMSQGGRVKSSGQLWKQPSTSKKNL